MIDLQKLVDQIPDHEFARAWKSKEAFLAFLVKTVRLITEDPL